MVDREKFRIRCIDEQKGSVNSGPTDIRCLHENVHQRPARAPINKALVQNIKQPRVELGIGLAEKFQEFPIVTSQTAAIWRYQKTRM